MERVLLVFGTAAMLVGAGLALYAQTRYRSASAPGLLSWRFKDWLPVWKTRPWFTDARAYRTYVNGVLLLTAGLVGLLIVFVR